MKILKNCLYQYETERIIDGYLVELNWKIRIELEIFKRQIDDLSVNEKQNDLFHTSYLVYAAGCFIDDTENTAKKKNNVIIGA